MSQNLSVLRMQKYGFFLYQQQNNGEFFLVFYILLIFSKKKLQLSIGIFTTFARHLILNLKF